MWGGGSGDNSLVGGAGDDEFFYLLGGSKDTITGYGTGDDVINLFGISLDDIDIENLSGDLGISSSDITLKFKDGGSLKVTGTQSETTFVLGDGTTAVATRKGSNRTWTL